MPRINLLPWREQQRTERKKAFGVGMGAAAVGAGLVTIVGLMFVNQMIDAQVGRNQLLEREIQVLDKQIEEINSLEQQKQQHISRMQIIEKLQASRPEIVHVFDTFVTTIPDGTFLTQITQTGRQFKVQGVAQSSARVSAFMKSLDASQWLDFFDLEVVEAAKSNTSSSGSQEFTIYANQAASAADSTPPATSAAARNSP